MRPWFKFLLCLTQFGSTYRWEDTFLEVVTLKRINKYFFGQNTEVKVIISLRHLRLWLKLTTFIVLARKRDFHSSFSVFNLGVWPMNPELKQENYWSLVRHLNPGSLRHKFSSVFLTDRLFCMQIIVNLLLEWPGLSAKHRWIYLQKYLDCRDLQDYQETDENAGEKVKKKKKKS